MDLCAAWRWSCRSSVWGGCEGSWTKYTSIAGNLDSYASIFHLLSKHQFDECYHLAAQSFVAESFADGFSTMATNINGTHYVLAALREFQPKCKFYFAGSSEMFGKVRETPQRESTPFHPRSPYGISKCRRFSIVRELSRSLWHVLL